MKALLTALILAALVPVGAAAEVSWKQDFDAALREAERLDKPLLAYFRADWCRYCRSFAQEVLTEEKTEELLDDYVLLKVDIDRMPAIAREHQIASIPQVHVLRTGEGIVARLTHWTSGPDFRGQLRTAREQSSPRGASEASTGASPSVDRSFGSPLITRPDGFRGQSMCYSHVGYGPLRLRSQSPFQALRQSFVPSPPSTITQGQFEVHASSVWTNTWANSETWFLLDYESLDSSISVSYGITDTLEVQVGLFDKSRFGGAMDSFIQGFHDAFDIKQGGRDLVPRDRMYVYFANYKGQSGVFLDEDASGTFDQGASFSVHHNLTCGTERLPAISYSMQVRHAWIQEDIRDGDNWDIGFSVSVSRRFGAFYGYLSAGYAYLGDETFRGIILKSTQLSGLLAMEWQFVPRWALVVQGLVSRGVTEEYGVFDEPSTEVTLGFKWEFLPGSVAEIGLIENLFITENSPDFGISLGLTHRFG